MLLNNVLENCKTEYLGKSKENVDLCLRTITELKKHNITIETLENQISKTEDVLLKTKLTDIYNIYSSYQNKILNNYIDEDDILTVLEQKIDKSKMFMQSYVFIDEFSGFTKQEYNIITKIMKQAKKVFITSCTDSLDISENPESDIFYSNKKTVNNLVKCSKEAKIELEIPIKLEKNYRFKNKELLILEKNIYNSSYQKYTEDVKNIYLNLYTNQYEEIENIAKIILNMARDGIRYNEIAIITKSIEEYSSIAKVIFAKYNIPIYIDENGDLGKKILIKYILAILDIFAKNWSNDAVWTYIKTGFIDISKNDIYEVENYCKKWGIKGNKWYKSDWQYDSKIEDINKLNQLRKQITNPLINLQSEIKNNKTASGITTILYNFLEQNNIKEKLNAKIIKLQKSNQIQLANEYIASWNLLIQVLDEIVLVFNDDKITFDKYREALKTGLQFTNLGTIPQAIDQIVMGDVERSRNNKIKIIFILGINDGAFPSINKEEGFLNDNDRENLKNNGIEIANGTLENLYEDQFNIYKAFSTAEEKLYLSYLSSDKDGKAKRQSVIISKIKKIFTKIQEVSKNSKIDITNDEATFGELLSNIRDKRNGQDVDEVWDEVYNWYINNAKWKLKVKKAIDGFNYKNISEILTKENVNKLYGDTLKTSVSRLEQYKKCPFSFYLKYGLKLKQEEEYTIKPVDTGTFMHDIIDTFFKEVKNVKEIEYLEIKQIVSDIIEEKLKLNKNYIFSSSSKFMVLTNRLKRVVAQSIKYITDQIKNSDFEIEGNEVEFTRNIDNITINGKIDRIDSTQTENGKYIRIIDYKSSHKDINLNEFMSGVQIQLITYIDSITDSKNTIPAGMLYFNLDDPVIPILKEGLDISDEQIEEKIRKEFKMNGMILADINIIRKMDKKLDKGYSDVIPVFINKDGDINSKSSNIITKDDFTKLQNTAKRIIKGIAGQILSGNIDINPVYNKRTKIDNCQFCEYKSICKFNPKINKYTYVENKKKEQILEELKGE